MGSLTSSSLTWWASCFTRQSSLLDVAQLLEEQLAQALRLAAFPSKAVPVRHPISFQPMYLHLVQLE